MNISPENLLKIICRARCGDSAAAQQFALEALRKAIGDAASSASHTLTMVEVDRSVDCVRSPTSMDAQKSAAEALGLSEEEMLQAASAEIHAIHSATGAIQELHGYTQ